MIPLCIRAKCIRYAFAWNSYESHSEYAYLSVAALLAAVSMDNVFG